MPSGLVGADLPVAEEALGATGLGVTTNEVFDPAFPRLRGRRGPRRRHVRKDGTVALDVSKGPDLRAVPTDLVGKPVADAMAALNRRRVHRARPAEYDDAVARRSAS